MSLVCTATKPPNVYSQAVFSYPNDIRVVKILVAANYGGVYVNVPEVPLPEATKTQEWRSKNPLNLFPWLDTPHGALFHTNAILRYSELNSSCLPNTLSCLSW